MNNASLRLAHTGETMFPFFLRAWGTSRFPTLLLVRKALGFPTPLPVHGPRVGP
jgi:hypothetical protein